MELYKEVLKDGLTRLHDAFTAMENAVRDADFLDPDERSEGIEILDQMRQGCYLPVRKFRDRYHLDEKE